MRSLQVPFHFYPEAVGGTEVYALSLAQQLRAAGHETHIAAPGDSRVTYRYQGLPVHRFTTSRLDDVKSLYGEGDAVATQQFESIVDETAPDLIHLHGISAAVSLRLLRRLKERGLPVVLTVHIPGILCSRGTLLRYGRDVCDGVVAVHKCSRCVLDGRGLPRAAAAIVGTVPVLLGAAIGRSGYQANWITALRMTELTSIRKTVLLNFLGEVDHIVAVSEWVRKALLDNGIPSSKITLCRHGATQSGPGRGGAFHQPRDSHSGTKRIAFVGRLNESKGAHMLVDAIVRCPNLPVRLDIYGIEQEAAVSPYVERLRYHAGRDERIRLLPPVANDEVPGVLRSYDALAVPSLWMETGPLVVYDAFLAGTPVIGSRRGGIAELVTHERNGLLVNPPDEVTAWSSALGRFCSEPGLVERLRRGIAAPRAMNAVAAEMLQLYRTLPAHQTTPALQ